MCDAGLTSGLGIESTLLCLEAGLSVLLRFACRVRESGRVRLEEWHGTTHFVGMP